jgi:hypothetical protein
MDDEYEDINYINNRDNKDKIDINKINIQYYDFLKNLIDKNDFEQQQNLNNFSNIINYNNNINNDTNIRDKKILLQTKKELNELYKERCKIIKTDHREDFNNNNNKSYFKEIIYCILDIIKKIIFYTLDILKTILNIITCIILILIIPNSVINIKI